ncbi:MAG TPA: GtrA family protein [Sphingomicrobium sp.]|jgi:putative flippase GtrA|nr:GtrA family protein [Sphingomicrobium sp.]
MLDLVYTRYIGASVVSLGLDFAVFMAALSLGVPPALAAATGYLAGIVCHWAISSRLVFAAQIASSAAGRRQQQALFVLSALVGLGITTAIVGIGSHFGLDPRIAKGVAIVVSFQATYVLRKKVVFA